MLGSLSYQLSKCHAQLPHYQWSLIGSSRHVFELDGLWVRLKGPSHAKSPKTQQHGWCESKKWNRQEVAKLQATWTQAKRFAAHWLCTIWRFQMDAYGTLVHAFSKYTISLSKEVDQMALIWHSAPHKCAKFRSSWYSASPRRQFLKISLPGMASTVNLNEMTKPRRHKSVGSVGTCCNRLQSRCMPTLHD